MGSRFLPRCSLGLAIQRPLSLSLLCIVVFLLRCLARPFGNPTCCRRSKLAVTHVDICIDKFLWQLNYCRAVLELSLVLRSREDTSVADVREKPEGHCSMQYECIGAPLRRSAHSHADLEVLGPRRPRTPRFPRVVISSRKPDPSSSHPRV